MHDSQIEDRLRSILRAEGDDLPMTITSSELERRLQLRRRRTRGRWVSLVAAAAAIIAIGAIVGLEKGFLAPAVGTRVSPPPSPSVGLSRIERDTQAPLVLEIEPTGSGGGVVQPLHQALARTDYVVSVKVLCLGDGTVSFTDRTHTNEVTCTKAAALDPVFQPDPILVPVIDGSFDTVLTVTPDIQYTMLVEIVPVPDHMPTLSTPEGSISMSSDTVTPTPGRGSGIQHASSRMVGSSEWIQVVCLGPGVVSYTLGPVDRSTSGTTSETVCDGVPREEEIAIDFSGDQVIDVATGDVAFQLVATRDGPLPAAVPSKAPSTLRKPLGGPSDAILVQPVGDPTRTPSSFEVARLDPTTNVSTPIASIPGSVIPGGTWISFTDAPKISATGWLAIAFTPGDGPTSDPAVRQGIVVVDVTDPEGKPWVIPDVSSATWNDEDELATVAATGVVIADPGTRTLTPFPIQDRAVSTYVGGPYAAPIWTTTPGTRFLAWRQRGGTTEWGYVDDAGRFIATTDLPPISQRTGIERRVGAGAHQLIEICTGGGTPTEAGCTLAETDATGFPVTTWVTNPEIAYLDDSAWAGDGHDTWLLFEGKAENGSTRVSLERARPNGRTEVGQVGFPDSGAARIIGISSDDQSTDAGILAIGTSSGFVDAFVDAAGGVAGQDGTAWFAGWAGAQAYYDPD